MTVQDYADDVAKDVNIDPLIIAGLIIAIIRLIMECQKTPKQAAAMIAHPNPIERLKLRRICRDQIPNRRDVAPALARAGKGITEEQVAKLYTQAAT